MKKWIQKLRLRNGLLSALYWLTLLLCLELMLHFVAFGVPGEDFFQVAGFSACVACVIAVVFSFLPERARLISEILLTGILILLFGSQMVYCFIFGTLYSVALMQQGGQAFNSFWKETLLIMWENLPWILGVLALGLLLWGFRKLRGRGSFGWSCRGILLGLAVAAQLLSLGAVNAEGTGFFSDHYFYHSDSTTTDQATERFGLLTAFRLDIFGTAQPEETEGYYVPTQDTQPEETEPEPSQTGPQETVPQETEPEEPRYNVLDIDFEALNTMTEDERIRAINNYCASLTGTNQNEYTGMLSDYNLIVLCAESFSTGAIHPELTPTLYRLSREGFVFENYYNTYPNNTTDGEYTLCMGLYPDGSRGKAASSFYASRNSYLPFCLGNVFRQQLGIETYGYHNYLGSYYGREKSHPNMGYQMKFAGDGMRFTSSWPASDLEMMEQSVDDYLTADSQFHAYYMTFSGHLKYDREANPMAARNWNMVKDLPISYAAKCYLSCNIELDKALAYLMERLEEAGVADRTAIVLAGDHYPYGLNNDQYEELVGYELDDFNKFKSTLIFWVGGLEEPIVVEEYCSNADILPTILNLWGFGYDSRMLAGTDVFSDGDHVAVLVDKSFYTDLVWLNASTGEIRYQVPQDQVPEGYIEDMIRQIETKLELSTDILNSAYYNFIFEKGDVTINRQSWQPKEPDPEPAPTETQVHSEN